MIAFLRTLWCRAFHRGFSRGYRNGFEAAQLELPTALPADVVEAYRRWKKRNDIYATPCTTGEIIKAIESYLPESETANG